MSKKTKKHFKVAVWKKNNPNWIKEEMILAMNAYVLNGKQIPNKKDIEKLAEEIQRVAIKLGVPPSNQNFRSATAVYTKIANLSNVPCGGGTKLETEVYNEFINQPAELKQKADEILSMLG